MSDRLLAGYQRFKNGYFSENREKLRRLAEQQRPNFVLIACCDARMEPAQCLYYPLEWRSPGLLQSFPPSTPPLLRLRISPAFP